jgi:hypothetical protein
LAGVEPDHREIGLPFHAGRERGKFDRHATASQCVGNVGPQNGERANGEMVPCGEHEMQGGYKLIARDEFRLRADVSQKFVLLHDVLYQRHRVPE